MPTILKVLLAAAFMGTATLHARTCLQEIAGPPEGYEHNRFGVQPSDQVREFSAYLVSFDGADDDDGDGTGDARRIPEWVAYEMRANGHPESGDRPGRWCHDRELEGAGLAARDRAYAYSRAFRRSHPDWFVRGHLAMRYHAVRLSDEAAWNTHTTLNAVPQRPTFNGGSWLSLECLTGAWANRYGAVWIVKGPIFEGGRPSRWIGEPQKNERRAAVPDKLFKIVVRNDDDVHVLAFIYNNATEPKGAKPNHVSALRSAVQVEKATGLVISGLPADLKASPASELWPVDEGDFLLGCASRKMTIEPGRVAAP